MVWGCVLGNELSKIRRRSKAYIYLKGEPQQAQETLVGLFFSFQGIFIIKWKEKSPWRGGSFFVLGNWFSLSVGGKLCDPWHGQRQSGTCLTFWIPELFFLWLILLHACCPYLSWLILLWADGGLTRGLALGRRRLLLSEVTLYTHGGCLHMTDSISVSLSCCDIEGVALTRGLNNAIWSWTARMQQYELKNNFRAGMMVVKEHWLFFQRTHVPFPTPTW